MSKVKSLIKFAIIGYGHIGRRHADVILNNKDCALVALCDQKPKEKLDVPYSNIPFFQSIEELLNSNIDFDVLCIATPNGLHEEHAVKAIRAGYHVVIEKPMALSKKGCEHIIYEAFHHHKHIFCVMQNRYSPPSIWLKGLVKNGALGSIYMVQINCYWNRDERYYTKDNWHGTSRYDGGTLFTQFSHFIDMMFWLFGDVENIKTRFNNFSHVGVIDFEDSGVINFDFVNGGMGCINYSTSVWDTNLESSITVIGENGSVKVGGQYMNKVEYCHIKNYSMPQLPATSKPNDYGAYKGSASNHEHIFNNVVDFFKSGAPISTNALEGLKVVEIIEKIYSYKNA